MGSDLLKIIGEKVDRIAVIDPHSLIFRDEFTAACQANRCGRYGTSWTCPPGIGDIVARRDQCLRYPVATMMVKTFRLEDDYDVEGMDAGRNAMMEIVYGLVDTLRAANQDFIALAPGSCSFCPKCTYPETGCRFPDRGLASIEALGIDVAAMARSAGCKYYNGPLTVTYFALLFTR